ncbi:hypothetical protein SpCBS45565_g05184 [Spizellomyces sp. 'palustris']|nr:hypothetical protein SpCBS45565_g05184 [Spizellomyces sp. 'palustris']
MHGIARVFFRCLTVTLATALPCERKDKDASFVVFGDSWSDTGNTFALTNKTWPTAAYYQGRFSNGPLWLEYLTESRKVDLQDYAFGGATTNNTLVQGYTGSASNIAVPSVIDQVATYLPHFSPNNVHAFWAGGNDVFFGLSAGVTGDQVAANLLSIVEKLSLSGAKAFLLFQLPALDKLPYFATKENIPLQPLFANWTTDFNTALTTRAAAFRAQHADAAVQIFDTRRFIDSDVKGYDNAQEACLNATTQQACAEPNKHVYWDAFHFTTSVHKDIAKEVGKLVKDWLK